MTARFRLFHTRGFDPTAIAAALESEGIVAERLDTADRLRPGDLPTALLLDATSRDAFPVRALRQFVDDGGTIVLLGAASETDIPEAYGTEMVASYVHSPWGPRQLLVALRAAYRETLARTEATRSRLEAATRTGELGELTRIGMALATERNLNTLLDLILGQARRMTSADAGSLYLVETPEDGPKRLRFKLSQNHSRPEIPFVEFTIPIDHASVAGWVASTREPVILDDAYQLPPEVEYSINRSFDEKYGYRTQSMLTLPMSDHRDQIIGVLQLINRKRDFDVKLESMEDFARDVRPFTRQLVELVSSLAGQAAVAIENSQLYESIERLFDGFVKAAVTAIEQRDPTTFGHSGRVATMTEGLARAVDRASDGTYQHVKFTRDELREIRFAGLLHDFGKVGVREQVLVKAKKLYGSDLALIKHRYAFIRRTAERDFEYRRAEYLAGRGASGYEAFVAELRAEQDKRLKTLDRFMQLVQESNEPTVLPEGSFEELIQYANSHFEDLEGQQQAFLTDDEVRFLTIRKGSLDEQERLEIESHVAHTYRFLLQIPWTKELSSIPFIAYGHHEKLNGAGYPRRVGGEQIPIQTRMMTIADIFDALTASDRPYKRAVPIPRALDIMGQEVEGGMLDPQLFTLFTDAKVFEQRDES